MMLCSGSDLLSVEVEFRLNDDAIIVMGMKYFRLEIQPFKKAVRGCLYPGHFDRGLFIQVMGSNQDRRLNT